MTDDKNCRDFREMRNEGGEGENESEATSETSGKC